MELEPDREEDEEDDDDEEEREDEPEEEQEARCPRGLLELGLQAFLCFSVLDSGVKALMCNAWAFWRTTSTPGFMGVRGTTLGLQEASGSFLSTSSASKMGSCFSSILGPSSGAAGVSGSRSGPLEGDPVSEVWLCNCRSGVAMRDCEPLCWL